MMKDYLSQRYALLTCRYFIHAFVAAIVLFAGSVASPLHAHGFYYVLDASTEFVANDEGDVSGLNIQWIYEPKMTEIMLQDDANLPKDKQVYVLKALGETIVRDLAAFGYYTGIKKPDHSSVVMKEARDASLELTEDKRLKLKFSLDFNAPLKLESGIYLLDAFDPYGTGLLTHKSIEDLRLPGNWQKQCEVKMEMQQTIPPGEEFEHEKAVQSVLLTCK